MDVTGTGPKIEHKLGDKVGNISPCDIDFDACLRLKLGQKLYNGAGRRGVLGQKVQLQSTKLLPHLIICCKAIGGHQSTQDKGYTQT